MAEPADPTLEDNRNIFAYNSFVLWLSSYSFYLHKQPQICELPYRHPEDSNNPYNWNKNISAPLRRLESLI